MEHSPVTPGGTLGQPAHKAGGKHWGLEAVWGSVCRGCPAHSQLLPWADGQNHLPQGLTVTAGGTLCRGNAWESVEWDPLQTWLPLPSQPLSTLSLEAGLSWSGLVSGSERLQQEMRRQEERPGCR